MLTSPLYGVSYKAVLELCDGKMSNVINLKLFSERLSRIGIKLINVLVGVLYNILFWVDLRGVGLERDLLKVCYLERTAEDKAALVTERIKGLMAL